MVKQVSMPVALAAVAGLAAGTAGAQQGPASGPVAVYWMSAATSTGMGAMGAGMGAGGPPGAMGPGGRPSGPPPQARRPGLGAMLGGALGGGNPYAGAGGYGGQNPYAQRGAGGGMPPGVAAMMGGGRETRSLTLQLGSSLRPTSGEPNAGHLAPPDLQAGQRLPLVTPQVVPPEPPEPGQPPQMTQRPQGKMLIYWGCGEHAAAPIVIDFAKLGPNMPVPNIPFVAANGGRPPSPGRYATYGEWPNERTRLSIPPEGSLVGAHAVQGNYSPDIRFNLGPNQDFLAPLNITSTNATPGGGKRVTWTPVPGATGYYAWLFGAGGGRNGPVVMWSSGSKANMLGALTDYLPPSEVRRLIGDGMVMGPQTSECIVPSEVVKASPFGMLSMIAYGEETNLSDPPRPAKGAWNLKWTVKVRRKSTTGALLGMPGAGDD